MMFNHVKILSRYILPAFLFFGFHSVFSQSTDIPPQDEYIEVWEALVLDMEYAGEDCKMKAVLFNAWYDRSNKRIEELNTECDMQALSQTEDEKKVFGERVTEVLRRFSDATYDCKKDPDFSKALQRMGMSYEDQ